MTAPSPANSRATARKLASAGVLKSLRFQGAEIMGKTLPGCQAYISSEYDRWSGTVKRLGLKAGS